MTKLEQEIKFLKAFKKRFSTTQMYKAAIEDMWKEGIITPKAYKIIIDAIDNLLPKAVLKKGIPSSAKKVVEIDPCSHGGSGYMSSC